MNESDSLRMTRFDITFPLMEAIPRERPENGTAFF